MLSVRAQGGDWMSQLAAAAASMGLRFFLLLSAGLLLVLCLLCANVALGYFLWHDARFGLEVRPRRRCGRPIAVPGVLPCAQHPAFFQVLVASCHAV